MPQLDVSLWHYETFWYFASIAKSYVLQLSCRLAAYICLNVEQSQLTSSKDKQTTAWK